MEPKPIITIHGELELIGPVLQKTLQNKLKQLQGGSDDKAFSSICNGVKFVILHELIKEYGLPGLTPPFLHNTPCLHTYWTSCATSQLYKSDLHNAITRWQQQVKGSNMPMMIIYCVTAEVRSKRPKFQHSVFGNKTEVVEQLLLDNFEKEGYCSVISLRLASANEERISESFSAFAAEVNRVCLSNFLRMVSERDDKMKAVRKTNLSIEALYPFLCDKLSLAIGQEMIRSHTLAGLHYSSIMHDFESSITAQTHSGDLTGWLCSIRDAPIKSWNHPSLLYPQECWKDLPLILANKANLIQLFSLLFTRHIRILCCSASVSQNMPASLQVSNSCIATLHSIARMINLLTVSLPDGAFNSWAFMTCMECLDSMMLSIDPEVLANTPSATLIQIRAELWHYAWEKLRSIGLLCNLMPGLTMEEKHNDIVRTICNGIVLPEHEVVGEEHLGKKLINTLTSKDKFKTEFMTLGELVIGAFKMSGRRRMAFSIGTMMAEFHKNVGLVKEAERLLSDVTSLHSVGHWPQLSSSAYSILAHCQKKLREEDKEVNSLIVLITTPNYSNSAHDPMKCMDQLIYIANVSKYQKLLSWEPLFELESVQSDQSQYSMADTIAVKFKFHYYGPKSIRLTNINFLLEREGQLMSNEPSSANKSTSETDGIESFEEVELDPGPVEEKLLKSRRIGGDEGSKVHKIYYTSNDMEGSEDVKFNPDLQLRCSSLDVEPGANVITVSGKISSPGTCYPYHIILKCGALDFCLVVPLAKAKTCPITVLQENVDISVALIPQVKDGVLLTGSTTLCQIRVNTGGETKIAAGSEILIKSPPNVELEAVKDATIQNLHSLGLTLPEIFPSGTTCVPFDLTATSVFDKEDPDIPDTDFSTGECLFSWEHELEVWFQWLTPPHLVRLPLTVYEPFVFTHCERSAGGDNSFLQITMINTCPLPLVLMDHQLHTPIQGMVPLSGDKPTIFRSGDTFSFLWQHRKGGSTQVGEVSAVFSIDYQLKTHNDQALQLLSRIAKYRFQMSNMETIYSLKCSVQSLAGPSQPITVDQTVIITYTVTNITKDFRDSTQGPETLHYSVSSDPSNWELNVQPECIIQAPRIAQSVSFKVAATPKQSGLLLVPSCSLVLVANSTTTDTDSSTGKDSIREELTGARCYNTCEWHHVEVS